MEGFTSATFPELALLCRCVRAWVHGWMIEGLRNACMGQSTHGRSTLCTPRSSVLDGADAGAFLREAVEATFARAVSLWARHTVGPLGV